MADLTPLREVAARLRLQCAALMKGAPDDEVIEAILTEADALCAIESTNEGLWGKSDIAAELAHRDARIAELEAALGTAYARGFVDACERIADSLNMGAFRQLGGRGCDAVVLARSVVYDVRNAAQKRTGAPSTPEQKRTRLNWIANLVEGMRK